MSLALIAVYLIGACSEVDLAESSVGAPSESSNESANGDGAMGTESGSDDVAQEQATPEPDDDPFIAALNHVQFVAEAHWVEIQAYAEDDTIIGSLVLTFHENDVATMTATFEDGTAEIQFMKSKVTSIDSGLPDEIIVQRTNALILEIETPEMSNYQGWAKCAAMSVIAFGLCYNPSTLIWACGASAFVAACECLPQLAKKMDWAHDEC
jgi:hypothetical protein